MSQSVRDLLAQACHTGEVIRIIYHGGSQPGSVREITAIKVSDSDVQARDLAVGAVRTFKLAKIELARHSTGAPVYDPNKQSVVELSGTIQDLLSGDLPKLESMGWHVRLSDNAIAVHRFFKNGKPRKTPDVELSYHEYTVDMVVDLDGTIREESRKSRRPYRLTSRNFVSAKTFNKTTSAVLAFIQEATTLAPAEAK